MKIISCEFVKSVADVFKAQNDKWGTNSLLNHPFNHPAWVNSNHTLHRYDATINFEQEKQNGKLTSTLAQPNQSQHRISVLLHRHLDFGTQHPHQQRQITKGFYCYEYKKEIS